MTPLGCRFAPRCAASRRRERERIDAMVDLLELKSVLRKPIETLSKASSGASAWRSPCCTTPTC